MPVNSDVRLHMPNATIAHRVLEVVAAFARGEAPASAIAASLELHEPALEGVSRDVRDRLHALSVQVIREDVTVAEQELLGLEPRNDALLELRRVLEALE
jgi:hypothetical protein